MRSRVATRHSLPVAVSLLALVMLAASSTVQAVQPSLSAIAPPGVQRGVEVELQFRGARLADAERLLFYSPGFEVKKIEPVDANSCKATLNIAADCRVGIHAVRIQTASGVSDLQTFAVGTLPTVAETEPNTEFSAPQPVEMNRTVLGVVENEDVDHFVVEAKQGQRIVAELTALRLGRAFFDPYLAILNAERFELAVSDDRALLQQDAFCSLIAPADGKYIIQVRDSAYGGDGNSIYCLHVGDFPRPTGVLPAGGRPGETLPVRYLGDPAGDFTGEIVIPADGTAAEHDVLADQDGKLAASPNVVRRVDLANVVENEPNDAREQATPGAAPAALNGVIEKPADVDYFKFTAAKGQQYDVRVFARSTLRSELDSVLYIQNAAGGNVGGNDDSGGPDSYLRFNCPEDGDYFVLVHDHLKRGGVDFAYRVEIAPVAPALTLGLPEKQQYVSNTLTVPRRNRTALLVSAARANWGGDLTLDFAGLPTGMTFTAPVMTANLTQVPVLFTAAADAPTHGALVDVIGRPTNADLKLTGHLYQRTMLVRGQNNRDVWGHDADRMATCLAAEVPFTIELAQPQVPIVRNGSMQLKVIAQRGDGFTAPIALRMLYNPPGIGSSGSISIKENETEALIPITANNGAAIGAWPIVVLGVAPHDGASVEVSTQLANLEIADAYFTFAFQKAAGEQGKTASVLVNVEKKVDFPEDCKVTLLGLPAHTSTNPEGMKITKDSTEIVFPVEIGAEAKPNTYKSLVCVAVIERNGEPITHTLGTGELRVDVPPPPKKDAPPAVAAAPMPQPAAAAPAPAKPLSRLEQLRLNKKEGSGG